MSHPPQSGRSFGSVPDAYHRGRPDYPEPAVSWLINGPGLSVLELGAGTGKLTRSLVAHGHDVHATDPSPEMLAVLSRELPEVRTSQASAERLPREDRSVDVVIAAQSFHWFDAQRALPEIARVLKPGGHLALVWNLRDERIPWVRRLGALIQAEPARITSTEVLEECVWFDPPVHQSFKHWQDINRDILVDLVQSRSYVANSEPVAQAQLLEQVRAFYDDFGRGIDGMQMPYLTECYRARVRKEHTPPGLDPDDTLIRPKHRLDGPDDDDLLLIDFR